MARPLTTRQRQILTALVEQFIASGEPVSSGAVARTGVGLQVSSATIRNEMVVLGELGLLEQPHTSAGRVPSAQAFRMYVQGLEVGAAEGGASRLLSGSARTQMELAIDSRLAGAAGPRVLLERTSGLLAALSSGVGIAVGAVSATDALEHVQFTRLAERRVLAVVVGRSGTVRDRLLTLSEDLSAVELETAGNFLNRHFRGWRLEHVRAEIERRIEQERTAYRQMVEAAGELWSAAVPAAGAEEPERAVFVEGVANLVGLQEDRGRLRELLQALEAKQRVAELLGAYIDTRQESVRVVFELEEQAPELAGLVLVAAPARMAGGTLGTVAVLGPTRMDYGSTIDAVGYVAGVVGRVLDAGVSG